MHEIWKDVEGFEGVYQVSNHGKVRSLPRVVTQKNRGGGFHAQKKPGKIVKGALNSKGYLRVSLGGKAVFVHRLVATHFVPNPLDKEQVNHEDGDKLNNRADNLNWKTNQENRDHAVSNNLHRVSKGEERDSAILTDEDIRWIRKHAQKHHPTMSYKMVADKFNVTPQHIGNIVKGKKWSHVQ